MKKSVLRLCDALLFVSLLLAAVGPAPAQWQTPNHSVPIGKGGGVSGFGNAAPGTAGKPFISNGAAADPSFGNIGNSGFTAGAADTYKGSLNGTTVVDVAQPPCTAVNQALRYTAGVGPVCATVSVQTGFDTPVNMGLSASVGGGALTINVTTATGGTPSASTPVLIPFRSTTLTAGSTTWSTVTAALSITVPSGASLGTTNATPFRIWIFADYNSGVPAIGVATCSTASTIYPCASWEYSLKTSTAIGAGSTSAGTLYATAGVALDAVRIIGFCEYSAGLATAGTYASACTTLQVFGPGIKRPGEVIQTARATTGAVSTGTTVVPVDDTIPQITEGDEYMTQAITPTSTANILAITSNAFGSKNAAGTLIMALFQGATAGALTTTWADARAGSTAVPLQLSYMMLSATVSSTTFRIRIGPDANTMTFNGAAGARLFGGVFNSYIQVQEIMG